jgi:DNA-binding response OmpR family regulator
MTAVTFEVKRLLIVEDDVLTRSLLKGTLEQAGYEIIAVADGPDALRYVERRGLPHLVLVDLHLPTMNGFELSAHLKRMGDVPIIILSGDDDENNIVRGISEYAEDYMIKPVAPRELVVRIERILSRIHDFGYAMAPILKVDDRLSVDFVRNTIWINGERIPLTPIETRLLSTLTQNSGLLLSPRQLVARGWPGEADQISDETLRVNLSRLRNKLTHGGARSDYIQNERGVGYRFVFPASIS